MIISTDFSQPESALSQEDMKTIREHIKRAAGILGIPFGTDVTFTDRDYCLSDEANGFCFSASKEIIVFTYDHIHNTYYSLDRIIYNAITVMYLLCRLLGNKPERRITQGSDIIGLDQVDADAFAHVYMTYFYHGNKEYIEALSDVSRFDSGLHRRAVNRMQLLYAPQFIMHDAKCFVHKIVTA